MPITLKRPDSWVKRYGIAIAGVSAAFLVRAVVGTFAADESPFLLLSVAVLVSAVFGGFGPAILATLLGAFVGDYFFLAPVGTLVPPSAAHGLRTAIFLVQGLAISAIGAVLVSVKNQAEADARRVSEERERMRFLSEAGEELSSSLDYRATLSRMTNLAVPRIADWCAVDILADDGSLERLAVAHEDPEKVELARTLQERYPPDPQAAYGAFNVLKSGEPELVEEIPEALLERVARDEDHLEILRGLGLASYMAVPLLSRGRTLGVLTLASSDLGSPFSDSDLSLAGELSRRAALAVDNAMLYDEANREIAEHAKTEERLRFLAGLERELQPLTEPGEIVAATARRLGEHLEVDRCAYAEVEEDEDHFRVTGDYTDGVPSIVGELAMSDFGQEVLRLMREGEPYVVEDVENDKRVSAESLSAYHKTQIRAVVCVPLRKAGRFVAAMAVHRQIPRSWPKEEVELISAVVNRCWESIERARALRSLRQTEERYRAAIEQAGDGIFLFDTETTRIVEANPALGEMLGYDPRELLQMSLYDLVPESPQSVDENVRNTLEYGYFLVGEREYRRKDGSAVAAEVSGNLLSFEGRRLVCAVARDITERRRSEEARREAREAERARIAREMHDTVLQDIVYALQEIQVFPHIYEGLPQPLVASLDESAEALRGSVEGLREAIFELRLQETAKRSMREAVGALIDLNRRMVRRAYGIELTIERGFPDQIPTVAAQGILRILQEALTNARRHAFPSRVTVRLGAGGEYAWAEVADDGRGFEPGSGHAGIGSHSMRERAEELGGELSTHSASGQGASVRLWVPRAMLDCS